MELEDHNPECAAMVEFLAAAGLHEVSRHKYVFGGDEGPFSGVYNVVFRRQALK